MGFAGDEADGGDGGRCRRRGYRVPAVELDALAGAPESGEVARVLKDARGGGVSSESSPEHRRSGGSIERNWGGLEAEGRRCLGEKEEEEQAVKWAWPRREINAALRRIDVAKLQQETA